MTVCVAALFRWNYGTTEKPDLGIAAVTASDRMITAGDIQYQPAQTKMAAFTPAVLGLIAGNYTIHSHAIQETQRQILGKKVVTAHVVATIYGQSVQAIKHKQAEDFYLAPLGLNADTFLSQQKEMSDHFVALITEQMQRHVGEDVEAIIAGADGGTVHLYHVGNRGEVRNYDDVGFVAIGIGAAHANSVLMQAGYTKTFFLEDVLANIYAAKKAAEVAPGVGTHTDMALVFRDGVTPFWPEVFDSLSSTYDWYAEQRHRLTTEAVKRLSKAIFAERSDEDDGQGSGTIGTDAPADGRVDQDAPKTARADEGGPKASEPG